MHKCKETSSQQHAGNAVICMLLQCLPIHLMDTSNLTNFMWPTTCPVIRQPTLVFTHLNSTHISNVCRNHKLRAEASHKYTFPDREENQDFYPRTFNLFHIETIKFLIEQSKFSEALQLHIISLLRYAKYFYFPGCSHGFFL